MSAQYSARRDRVASERARAGGVACYKHSWQQMSPRLMAKSHGHVPWPRPMAMAADGGGGGESLINDLKREANSLSHDTRLEAVNITRCNLIVGRLAPLAELCDLHFLACSGCGTRGSRAGEGEEEEEEHQQQQQQQEQSRRRGRRRGRRRTFNRRGERQTADEYGHSSISVEVQVICPCSHMRTRRALIIIQAIFTFFDHQYSSDIQVIHQPIFK